MSPDTLRAAFDRQGYAIARGVFGPPRWKQLEAQFDRIVEQLRASGEHVNARWGGPAMDRLGAAGTEVVHTHNVQRYSAVWADALRHPPFLDLVEALLGPDIVLHHTKLFEKPAGRGAPFPLHQDWAYFPTRNDSMLARRPLPRQVATDDPRTHRLRRAQRRAAVGSRGQGRRPASCAWMGVKGDGDGCRARECVPRRA